MIHFLGCDPNLLTMQLELAQESQGARVFRILQNIPVELNDKYEQRDDWDVLIVKPDDLERLDDLSDLAFSVVTPSIKKKVYAFFAEQGALHKSFINLVHPTSYIAPSAKLDLGIQIEPNSTIASLARIGFGVNIKRASNIGHHCVLNEFVTINPGVTMSSFVEVGKGTTIGSGSIIRDGIKIGENCLIGAGSVVVKDIADNSVAFGNPCKVHRSNSQ